MTSVVNPFSRLIHKKIAKAVILSSLFFIFACTEQTTGHFKLSGFTMGTSYHITVVNNTGVKTESKDLKIAIDKQLQLINQQMSTYIQDSELSQLNDAPVNKWVVVSPDLFDVLMLSHEIAWLSNGAFDITVGPLVNLWGFGPDGVDRKSTVPDNATINHLLISTDFKLVEFNLETTSIRKKAAVTLDLSGIAKGYGVDKVAKLLSYAGYTDFMVEIGGELYLQGNSPRGTPWRIAIEQPNQYSTGEVQQAVIVSSAGMATSGDYRNYFEKEGKRYSHTIDPATGYPITHKLASVTVIAESSAYADALATAITVMGPDKGLRLADQQGLAVYMIVKSRQGFKAIYSDAFNVYLD